MNAVLLLLAIVLQSDLPWEVSREIDGTPALDGLDTRSEPVLPDVMAPLPSRSSHYILERDVKWVSTTTGFYNCAMWGGCFITCMNWPLRDKCGVTFELWNDPEDHDAGTYFRYFEAPCDGVGGAVNYYVPGGSCWWRVDMVEVMTPLSAELAPEPSQAGPLYQYLLNGINEVSWLPAEGEDNCCYTPWWASPGNYYCQEGCGDHCRLLVQLKSNSQPPQYTIYSHCLSDCDGAQICYTTGSYLNVRANRILIYQGP